MKSRTNIRIACIKNLYEAYVREEDIANILKEKGDLTPEEIELINVVYSHKGELDQIISQNLQKYSLGRLNLVDLAIIELATYELKYTDTPKAIVINEALNISRAYTMTDKENTVRFNNRLLDNISHFIEENK